MEDYNLVVIGGGPSGFAAAMRAIDFGKKVLLGAKWESQDSSGTAHRNPPP